MEVLLAIKEVLNNSRINVTPLQAIAIAILAKNYELN